MKPLLQDKQLLDPEALALARDWDDTAWNLIKSQAKIQKCVVRILRRIWRCLLVAD